MAYGIIKVDTVTFTDAGIDKSVSISGLVQNPTFSGNVTVTGTLSGVTVTGTTANFVSGVFSSQISGTTVTGTTARFTSGVFANISGGTHTITSGVFAAGSAASPSISFTSDPNTGIYSPGADQLALSTNGTGRLFIDNSGRVGIGTATPGHNLEVRTSGVTSLQVANTGQSSFTITEESSGESRLVCGGTSSFLTVHTGSTPTERARIDSSGRLLVGTSSASILNNSYLPSVQVAGTTLSSSAILALNAGNDASGPTLALAKRRNTTNWPALVNDSLGSVSFYGENGTYLRESASIKTIAGDTSIPATSMTPFIGVTYTIVSVGTTNFTLYGASSNTPGVTFQNFSSGPFTGTGRVMVADSWLPGNLVFSTSSGGSGSSNQEQFRITSDSVICYNQTIPPTKSGAATLTFVDLKIGIIQYTGAAATLTLPTGTQLESGFSGIYTQMTFQWSVINTGSGTCTIGAATGHTIVGAATITAGASGRFASRRTGSNTFVSYRLS